MSAKISEKEMLLLGRIGTLNEEIERLNKLLDETRQSELNKEYIINELEKYLNYNAKHIRNNINFKEVLDKIKELRGNSNE